MVPRVNDTYPIGTQKSVSLDFDEECAGEDRQGNTDHIFLLKDAAVTWVKFCRYGVKLYPINQSIKYII